MELRQELTQFIEGFMSQGNFVSLIVNFTDGLIQNKIVNSAAASVDVRDIDLAFQLIGIFTGAQHKKVLQSMMMNAAFIIEKYGFLLFSPRILE
jgi:hypothetical protein